MFQNYCFFLYHWYRWHLCRPYNMMIINGDVDAAAYILYRAHKPGVNNFPACYEEICTENSCYTPVVCSRLSLTRCIYIPSRVSRLARELHDLIDATTKRHPLEHYNVIAFRVRHRYSSTN